MQAEVGLFSVVHFVMAALADRIELYFSFGFTNNELFTILAQKDPCYC